MSERERAIEAFLHTAGWGGATRGHLAGDASFRRYERLQRGGDRAVLMDAPPPEEDVRPFVAIAETLRGLGLSAPDLFAADEAAGFLLLEDFGDATYTNILAADGDEEELYLLAVEALIHLHRRFGEEAAIPRYDDTRLLTEARLLTDWYMPAILGEDTPGDVTDAYEDAWRSVFPAAREVPSSLVLRDFHVDNLIRLPDRPGVAGCGLLDFQDAVVGPVSYDLVSLFEDARRDVPTDLTERLLAHYLSAFPALGRDELMASYAILGAQRSAKILGIFTRLDRRDGKPLYLPHIPRVWRWLEGDLAHPALAPVKAWFDEHLPAARRIVPPPVTRR